MRLFANEQTDACRRLRCISQHTVASRNLVWSWQMLGEALLQVAESTLFHLSIDRSEDLAGALQRNWLSHWQEQ